MDVKYNTDNTATVITDGTPTSAQEAKDFLNGELPFGEVVDKLILTGTNTFTFSTKSI